LFQTSTDLTLIEKCVFLNIRFLNLNFAKISVKIDRWLVTKELAIRPRDITKENLEV
jgi:hypothetical protein